MLPVRYRWGESSPGVARKMTFFRYVHYNSNSKKVIVIQKGTSTSPRITFYYLATLLCLSPSKMVKFWLSKYELKFKFVSSSTC